MSTETKEMEMAEKMVQFPVRLPEPLYNQLRQVSFDEHTSLAEIIRRALDEHLNPPAKKAKSKK